MSKATWDLPCGNSESDGRVYAYTDYLKRGNLLFAETASENRRGEILTLATEWGAQVQRGSLKPLVPVSYEDSPEQGERGRILFLKTRIVNFLIDDAQALVRHGHVASGTKEVVLALQLSESLRYSDLTTVYCGGIEESEEIEILRKCYPRLDAHGKIEVKQELHKLDTNRIKLKGVIRTARQQYFNWRLRVSRAARDQEVRTDLILVNQFKSNMSDKDMLEHLTQGGHSDDSLQHLFVELRLAWRSGKSTLSHTRSVLAQA